MGSEDAVARLRQAAAALRAAPIPVETQKYGTQYVLRLRAAQIDYQAVLAARKAKDPDYVDEFATARQLAFMLCDEHGVSLYDFRNEDHLREIGDMWWSDVKKLLDAATPTTTENGGVVGDPKNLPTESGSTSTSLKH